MDDPKQPFWHVGEYLELNIDGEIKELRICCIEDGSLANPYNSGSPGCIRYEDYVYHFPVFPMKSWVRIPEKDVKLSVAGKMIYSKDY